MKQSTLQKQGWDFAYLPAAVFLSADLTHASVTLFAYLLWRQGLNDRSWPKVTKMAGDLHMSEQAVRESLRNLIENDWIRRERNYGHSSNTYVFQTQELCRKFIPRSATRVEDEALPGQRMKRYPDSRLNENHRTRMAREDPSRPVRGQTPRTPDPEIMTLSQEFVSLTGIPWLEPKTKAGWAEANKLWLTPLRKMFQIADGHSSKILAEAVRQMRKDSLTISSPASVRKVFVSIYGEKHKKMDATVSDPFASYRRMMDEREAKEADDENHR